MIIKIGKGMSDKFETRKGIRQRCVMSFLLFNLYIANINRYMEEREIDEIKLGRN